jgi:hypothetical protein
MARQPPALLQIVREPWRPGSDAAFAAIEEARAGISVRFGCPHPYLGAESLMELPRGGVDRGRSGVLARVSI